MTDALLQIAASNVLMSCGIAAIAFAVHRSGRWPGLAHVLWVLVLVKLITPPIFTLPVVPIPMTHDAPTGVDFFATPIESLAAPNINASDLAVTEATRNATNDVEPATSTRAVIMVSMAVIWALGILVLVALTLIRVVRFNRLLAGATLDADAHTTRLATEVATRLGLRTPPQIRTTSARLAPLLWWTGGAVRIVLPAGLTREMDDDALRLVLAHECGHVRRRDHVVRWLEWLACTLFWWNPVAWFARRSLRLNEEICCDALVLAAFETKRQTYADTLMRVVEFLATPVIRPPALASGITGAGALERRFSMIVSKTRLTPTPRWLVAGLLAATTALLPMGVAYAQDAEAVGKRLKDAVAAGELTADQADVMMNALMKDAKSDSEQLGARLKRAVEAGDLTVKDARRKYEAAMERRAVAPEAEPVSKSRDVAMQDLVKQYKEYERRLEVAVEAGEVSEREAHENMAAYQRHLDAIAAAPDRAVRARNMRRSREAAESDSREDHERRVAEVKAMIEAGRLSHKEGLRILEEAEAVAKKRADALAEREVALIRRDREVEAMVGALKKQLAVAVDQGALSRAEAEQKMAKMLGLVQERRALRGGASEPVRERARSTTRERVREREPRVKADIDIRDIARRIEMAVDRGVMTREEANVLHEGLRRSMDSVPVSEAPKEPVRRTPVDRRTDRRGR